MTKHQQTESSDYKESGKEIIQFLSRNIECASEPKCRQQTNTEGRFKVGK